MSARRGGVGGVILAAALAFDLTGCGERQPGGETQAGAAVGEAAQGAAEAPLTGDEESPSSDRLRVTLFFPDDAGTLKPEKRDLPLEGTTADQARLVVEALLEGPRGRLTPALPRDATLRAFYLRDTGTAYVDLDVAFARGVSAGSEDALLAVWSITDTLAVNFADVQRVKFLVEGEEVRDLGGHLDLSRPLVPDLRRVGGAGNDR